MTQQDINILQKTIGNQAVIKLLTDIKKIPPKNSQPGQDNGTTPGTQDKQQESKVIQRITQEEAMRLSKQNTHDANEGNTWNIKAGEYNIYVFEAQDMLRDIGYNLSKRGVDGKWSPDGETYKALLKFQKTCKDTYNGLKQNAPAQTLAQVKYMQGVEPTGKLDKATYDALKKEKGNKIIRVKEENERKDKSSTEAKRNSAYWTRREISKFTPYDTD